MSPACRTSNDAISPVWWRPGRAERRKRASALSVDFTPEGAQAFFDYRRRRNMSAALDRLKQQNEPEQSQQQLGSPETMELLTSILAAVEAQNTRIATLTEQQKKLAGFVKVMDEETTRRAERIIAATAKLEVRQLWSAAAAMCLVLLPVVVVVAGLWMGIAGLITGVQWALDVSVWLGIGRWLVVGTGLAGAGYGVFASVRWVAGLVETWKGRGMPKWPRWRKR